MNYIKENKLFEENRGYIIIIIKGCLENESERHKIQDIWQSLSAGLEEDVAYKKFFQNLGESYFESQGPP